MLELQDLFNPNQPIALKLNDANSRSAQIRDLPSYFSLFSAAVRFINVYLNRQLPGMRVYLKGRGSGRLDTSQPMLVMPEAEHGG